VRSPSPALVLFDIDGTLIRGAGPHHKQALVDAIRCVTGIETTANGIPVHGMLDRDILTLMMQAGGLPVSRIRRVMPEIVQRAQSMYARRCPDLREKTCPGVRALLGRLRRRGVPMGLVTGNLTRIGWMKMRRAGLYDHFRFGAFSEMARDRAGLARLAVRRAKQSGWIDGDALVTLIGDAPADILAARANGIRSVAVETGLSLPADLATHSPDVQVADLRALRLSTLLP